MGFNLQMKKLALFVVIGVLSGLTAPISSAVVVTGTACKPLNSKTIIDGKIYTCKKTGKKLLWSKGIEVPRPVPIPKPTVNAADNPYLHGMAMPGYPPISPTDFMAVWSKDSIELMFNWDPNLLQNKYGKRFLIGFQKSKDSKSYVINAGGGINASDFINTSSIRQVIKISQINMAQTYAFGLISDIKYVNLQIDDGVNKTELLTAELGPYVSPFPKPQISLSKLVDSYAVDLNNLSNVSSRPDYYGFIVEEIITPERDKSKIDLSVGWRQAKSLQTSSPVQVFTPNNEHRWVRVKFIDKNGLASSYSEIFEIN